MAGITDRSAKVVAQNIVRFTKGFLREVNKDMEKVRKLLDDRVEANISLSDHSLKQLADMGHPYATRSPQHIHDPEYQVHSQSGVMLAGKFSGTERVSIRSGKLVASAFVGIEGVAHAVHVIFGTSRMIPRDFLDGSLQEEAGEARKLLGRSLKNVVVNFNGKKVKL